MFNFGGMLSGIGDVGYMKVKKGIQAKQDKQMIETRAALQRKATIEAREYSRQQKKLTESKKLTLLILLWIIDKIIMLIMLYIMR